jgi:hypothetical protein
VNPKAHVTLPDGFYDTDEEEAARVEARLNRKLTSKFEVYANVDDPHTINQGRASKIKKRPCS